MLLRSWQVSLKDLAKGRHISLVLIFGWVLPCLLDEQRRKIHTLKWVVFGVAAHYSWISSDNRRLSCSEGARQIFQRPKESRQTALQHHWVRCLEIVNKMAGSCFGNPRVVEGRSGSWFGCCWVLFSNKGEDHQQTASAETYQKWFVSATQRAEGHWLPRKP